mgnify:CR=1 FL=1
MSILGGLDRPSNGHYFFEGLDVAQLDEPDLARLRSERLGFVFQSFNLLEGFSALENVMVGMRFGRAFPRSERLGRATHLLERVGLARRLHSLPARLSVGERQRVPTPRALPTRTPSPGQVVGGRAGRTGGQEMSRRHGHGV